MNNQCLTEKYRPKKLSECVLPYRIKSKLEKWKNKMPMHLIFYGNAGVGKTSTAIALAKQKIKNAIYIISIIKNIFLMFDIEKLKSKSLLVKP
jgi:replication-associated recombination protein RarA